MRGKYKSKNQRKDVPPNSQPSIPAKVEQKLSTEPDGTKEGKEGKQNPMSFVKLIKSDPKFRIEVIAVVVGLAVLIVYSFQLCVMQHQLRLDQRAWVGVVLPGQFPLNGTVIPATIQVTSFGKTPARQVEGDIIATV